MDDLRQQLIARELVQTIRAPFNSGGNAAEIAEVVIRSYPIIEQVVDAALEFADGQNPLDLVDNVQKAIDLMSTTGFGVE